MRDPFYLPATSGELTVRREGRPAEPIGFHVMMRLEDDRPIVTTMAALRVIARVVLGQGERRGLVAFGMADDHLHAVLATRRAIAGAFVLYVANALQRRLRLGSRFERARILPLHDQRHAYNAFRYVHRQDSRHGLDRDHEREGTSLPDLVGMRLLGTSLADRVRAHLPRVRPEELSASFPPRVFDEQRPIDLAVLSDAAAAALGLLDLRDRWPDVARARRAAVHAAGPETPSSLLGDCLGIGLRAVQGIRSLAHEPALVRAVRMQARLRGPA